MCVSIPTCNRAMAGEQDNQLACRHALADIDPVRLACDLSTMNLETPSRGGCGGPRRYQAARTRARVSGSPPRSRAAAARTSPIPFAAPPPRALRPLPRALAAALLRARSSNRCGSTRTRPSARRREREEAGAKRVEEVRRRESERYARQQREIEEEYRKRALESARLDTYEDPRNRHD